MAAPPRLGFATRAVHAGAAPDPATGARAMPIYQSNGFVFEDLEHGADLFTLKRAGFAYARGSNPNTAALERRIADLSKAEPPRWLSPPGRRRGLSRC